MKIHEYAFDVKMFAAIRVRATSETEARKLMSEHVSAIDCTAGDWPNGTPITFETSIDDEEGGCLFEIDGKHVE